MVSVKSILLAIGLTTPLCTAHPANPSNEIEVDVAIIGGGSAGIYAATRLVDHNKSVIVLEADKQIGGHAQTYYDPATSTPVNLGVVIFTDTEIIRNYLTRYNVPLGQLNLSSIAEQTTYPVDYSTGRIVTNVKQYSLEEQAMALQAYGAQLAKYPGITFGYDFGSPVPEDLVMPFRDFVDKYNLQAIVPSIYQFNQGFVPILDIPTLYVLKYFGPYQLESFQKQYFLLAANGDTRTLYKNAELFLGKRILYSVSGLQVNRGSEGVHITVGNSNQGGKVIKAKKLIFAVPPTLERLQSAGFDLDQAEMQLFGKFFYNAYYSLVLSHTGIQTSLLGSSDSKPYNIPDFPGTYQAVPTAIDGIVNVFYGSPYVLSNQDVADRAIADIERLPASLRGNSTDTPCLVDIVAHYPFNPMVNVGDIEAGFYRELEGQQGRKSTWYIGGAWATASSSTIWEGLERAFLPAFLASL